MKLSIALISLLLTVDTAYGQFKKIHTQEVNDAITTVAVDRPGDLYIVTKEGQLQHFDKDGKLLSLYKKGPAATLFDPRDGSRLFAYFRQEQQYAYLNPSFEITQLVQIDSAFSIDPWLVCASGDYNIWILDAADWSLKKVDIKKGIVLAETVMPSTFSKLKTDYLTLREYQGFLFITDQTKGVHVFNGMGKYLRTIAVPKPFYINFLGEEMYYQSGVSLTFFDLFSTETREVKLPAPGTFTVVTDERLFLINPRQIDIYQIKSE